MGFIISFQVVGFISALLALSQPFVCPRQLNRQITKRLEERASVATLVQDKPLSKHIANDQSINGENIQDIYFKNFRPVRLRCRPDLYSAPYNTTRFYSSLATLSSVGDKETTVK